MKLVLTVSLVALTTGCAHVPCSIASEACCKASVNCAAHYSPSFCGEGPDSVCTADLVYRGCSAIPEKDIAATRQRFERCREMPGAKWSSSQEAERERPKNGRCVCADPRRPLERILQGEMRYVARAADSGIASNDGRVLDEGVVLSPTGKPACLTEQAICELNGGRWKSPVPVKEETRAERTGCHATYVTQVVEWDGKVCTIRTFDQELMRRAPCEGVTLLRQGEATVVVDTRQVRP